MSAAHPSITRTVNSSTVEIFRDLDGHDDPRIVVTTGKMITTFRDADDAADQIGLLHEKLETLEETLRHYAHRNNWSGDSNDIFAFADGWQLAEDDLAKPQEPTHESSTSPA